MGHSTFDIPLLVASRSDNPLEPDRTQLSRYLNFDTSDGSVGIYGVEAQGLKGDLLTH